MARARSFKHPKKGFSGRVNGVEFVDGVGEATGKAQAFWLERHGFKAVDGGSTVGPVSTEPVAPDVSAPDEAAT